MPSTGFYGAIQDKGFLSALFTAKNGEFVIIAKDTLARAFGPKFRDCLIVNAKSREAKALASHGISNNDMRKAFERLSDDQAMQRIQDTGAIPSTERFFKMIAYSRNGQVPASRRIETQTLKQRAPE